LHEVEQIPVLDYLPTAGQDIKQIHPMHQETSKAPELKGRYVVLLILALTAVVGTFFIYVGPKATEKTPGIVHVGIRYLNEQTIEFLKYGKKGPPATIELVNESGEVAYTMNDLRLGRNLMPLEELPSGPYTVRASSEDFQTVEVPVIVEGRMLNPTAGIEFIPGTYADYNMIGIRFRPLETK
jgi:hypothetical protein